MTDEFRKPFTLPALISPPMTFDQTKQRGKATVTTSGQVFEDDEQDILRHLLDIEGTAPNTDKFNASMHSFSNGIGNPNLQMHIRQNDFTTHNTMKQSRGWTEDTNISREAAPVDLAKSIPVKKPHECDICHKRFRAKSELITHERIHTGHKPFKCMYEGCTKRFAHSSNLGAHHKAHQGIKPYICMHEGCGKRYAHSGSLKEHVWKHYGVKPFKCSHPECDRTFTQRSNYSRHMKKCHGQEKEPSPPMIETQVKSELSYM